MGEAQKQIAYILIEILLFAERKESTLMMKPVSFYSTV
jgi:hypothetical protein